MNSLDAAISQYSLTITQLSARLAQAAAELAAALEQVELLTKERDSLKPKEAPKLEAVQSEAPAAV